MFASVLSVILALVIFFKFDSHRFRSLYTAVACAILLPLLTATTYAVGSFIEQVGIQGFLNDSLGLIIESLLSPFKQLAGMEVSPSVVFPGWLMVAAIIFAIFQLIKSMQAPSKAQSA